MTTTTPRRRGPVFVAGCPRSGTSALSWAVAACPGYWTSVETHFFYYLLGPAQFDLQQVYKRSEPNGSWLSKHQVGYPEFLRRLGSGLDELMLSRCDGKQWVDGSPENVMVGEQLLQMFPEAALFIVIRDPRAVCLSMLTSGFDMDWASDISRSIETWKHYIRVGQKCASRFPDRVLQIRQEDMLGSAQFVAEAIAMRLDLDDPGPIAGFLTRNRVNSSFKKGSYMPNSPYASTGDKVDPVRFYQEYGARIFDSTEDLAAHYGYRRDAVPVAPGGGGP
jgi:hypothetical protein